VTVEVSGETGEVLGRAEYTTSANKLMADRMPANASLSGAGTASA
jgi:hypothetical protein